MRGGFKEVYLESDSRKAERIEVRKPLFPNSSGDEVSLASLEKTLSMMERAEGMMASNPRGAAMFRERGDFLREEIKKRRTEDGTGKETSQAESETGSELLPEAAREASVSGSVDLAKGIEDVGNSVVGAEKSIERAGVVAPGFKEEARFLEKDFLTQAGEIVADSDQKIESLVGRGKQEGVSEEQEAKSSLEALVPAPEEPDEKFLERANSIVSSIHKRHNPTEKRNGLALDKPVMAEKLPQFQETLYDTMAKLSSRQESLKKMTPTENVEVYKNIEEALTASRREVYGAGSDPLVNQEERDAIIKQFAHTNQSREFFPNNDSRVRKDAFPYAQSLFGVRSADSPEARAFLKKKIESKNIYLFGGGDSVVDLIADKEIRARSITNLDPFVSVERVEKGQNPGYQSVGERADGKDLLKTLKERMLPSADEIWASMSVPMYLERPEDISQLLDNIKELLAPGGTARIYPLEVGRGQDFEANKAAFLAKIKELQESEDYNVYLAKFADHLTLFIKRLQTGASKEGAAESDKQENTGDVIDAEIIEDVRGGNPKQVTDGAKQITEGQPDVVDAEIIEEEKPKPKQITKGKIAIPESTG